MRSCGANYTFSAENILLLMADVYGDALIDQLLGRGGRCHIRAGYNHTHPLQHQTQRAHRNTSDAHQMDTAARLQIHL